MRAGRRREILAAAMHAPFTTASALEASRAGQLEAWVHAFLLGEGGNRAFSDGLRRAPRRFHGPLALPLRELVRCAGPEPEMEFRVPAEVFELRVGRIAAAIRSGQDLPPLIVNYRAGRPLAVSDGNHRLEALRRLGRAECAVIVWTTGAEDAVEFEGWRATRTR
jgi:hypothetical protein